MPALRSSERPWREGGRSTYIKEVDPGTLQEMIHYIYTGELADGWQDLDIQDVTIAADMYDLPDWMELFPYHNSVAIQNLVP